MNKSIQKDIKAISPSELKSKFYKSLGLGDETPYPKEHLQAYSRSVEQTISNTKAKP